jgi:hypothetical protein
MLFGVILRSLPISANRLVRISANSFWLKPALLYRFIKLCSSIFLFFLTMCAKRTPVFYTLNIAHIGVRSLNNIGDGFEFHLNPAATFILSAIGPLANPEINPQSLPHQRPSSKPFIGSYQGGRGFYHTFIYKEVKPCNSGSIFESFPSFTEA